MVTVRRRLFHFVTSPFARRVRLALAHKKLDVELCDTRKYPAFSEEVRKLTVVRTVPVLVEPDGSVLADSSAIAHYLDKAYTDAPPLWLAGHAGFEIAALVDVALGSLVDLGTRYYTLRDSAKWDETKGEMLGRAQSALDGLAARAAGMGATVHAAGWSAPDMWLFTMTTWLEGLPARAASAPFPAQIVSLGWRLPEALTRWANAHRSRADVLALDS
jgi:glutathione S-transferase